MVQGLCRTQPKRKIRHKKNAVVLMTDRTDPSRTLSLHGLAAMLLIAAGLSLPAGMVQAQAAAPADSQSGPRTNPYADAPVIQAPDEDGFNSFVSSDAAAPGIGFSGLHGAPVVIELFTSQGCSSCPATDAMMAELADDPGVLPLSFHVDYWDYLGWADKFAQPEFTRRQQDYARSVGERAVYTPQLIVGGEDTAPSLRPAELMALVDAHRASPAMVNVARHDEGDQQVLELRPLSDLGGTVSVALIRYAPERTVTVEGGENSGREITYSNVVLDLQQLANWDGRAPLRLTIGTGGGASEDFPPDTQHAILIQRLSGDGAGLPGSILTALELD